MWYHARDDADRVRLRETRIDRRSEPARDAQRRAKERGKCRSFARSAASMRSKRTAFMYSLTPAQSGNPGMRAWQNSTNASFAAITTGVVGHSVSSRSKVMTSMGRRNRRARTSTRAPRSATRGTRARHRTTAAAAASPAATSGAGRRARLPSSRARRCAGEVPSAEETRAKIFVRRVRYPQGPGEELQNERRSNHAARAHHRARPPPGTSPPRAARARVAARGKTAAARGAFPVGAADARARDGSTSNTFKMMSASRLSRGAVRVSASASASAPDAGAPGAADDADAALASSPRLYPHLELDSTPSCPSPRSRAAWRARGRRWWRTPCSSASSTCGTTRCRSRRCTWRCSASPSWARPRSGS